MNRAHLVLDQWRAIAHDLQLTTDERLHRRPRLVGQRDGVPLEVSWMFGTLIETVVTAHIDPPLHIALYLCDRKNRYPLPVSLEPLPLGSAPFRKAYVVRASDALLAERIFDDETCAFFLHAHAPIRQTWSLRVGDGAAQFATPCDVSSVRELNTAIEAASRLARGICQRARTAALFAEGAYR